MKPGSITCEDVPYPHPVSYLPMTLYGQDIRMAYMDVPAQGQPNGRTVVLFHGMNFAGFYWGGPIDALRKEGFRVVVPDQIGFGRSSKPIIPYNFHDMARNTRLLLQHLKIDKAFIVGHSMGGMLAARFATQYPDVAERVVIYNPIGLLDPRYERPWGSIDEAYKRNLGTTYQQIHAGIFRYFSHNPSAWKPEFDKYPKIRYAWTLSADWPRYAMVQALLGQMTYLDPVVQRLGAHQGADARVRRRRGQPRRTGERVSGAHEVHRRQHSERQRPAASHSGAGPRAALRGAGENVSAAHRISQGRVDVEMNLRNATALVTGGSSGIGLAIAKAWSMQARAWPLPAAIRTDWPRRRKRSARIRSRPTSAAKTTSRARIVSSSTSSATSTFW